jgi:hypothetical protein
MAAALAPGSDKKTMLGMPATGLPQGAPDAASAAPVDPMRMPPANRTMLGVAMPGIAPTHSAPEGAPGAPRAFESEKRTMLGVAVPGIAPTHAGQPTGAQQAAYGAQGATSAHGQGQAHAQPHAHPHAPHAARPAAPIVPAPPPLVEEPLPEARVVAPKRGVPVVAVMLILIAVTMVLGGAGAYVALRGRSPLTAQPQLDEAGHESLKLGCPTCPDGTDVVLGASRATVKGAAAVLALPAPLAIGDNELTLHLDRPGAGRDEDVKIHVPVAYRVRADLTTLSARPPAITVRVEATPGSAATVEGKPLALDANGRAAYAIDLTKDTEGPADETRTFDRKIPFSITPKGGATESGSLTARTAIVPVHIDSPGLVLYTDKPNAPIAGQTRAGATITIDGASAPVDAQGRFGVRAELGIPSGDKTLEIVASSPPLAPRFVHAKIVRVASLAEAAKDLAAEGPIAYDAFGADPASKAGQKAVVEGEVVDVRASQGHTVLLVDERKACPKGASCLVRVRHGEEDKVASGDTVRAFGRVTGSVSAGGKTVPDVDASLVLPLKVAR